MIRSGDKPHELQASGSIEATTAETRADSGRFGARRRPLMLRLQA